MFLKCKLRDVLEKMYSGGTPSTEVEKYWGGHLRWLSSGETSNSFIEDTINYITEEGVNNSTTKLAPKNSVVIACAGQGKTRGQVSYLHNDTYINQSIICFIPNGKVLPLYLFYNLKNRYDELRGGSDASSTRGSITTQSLRSFPFYYPSIKKIQEKIVNILYSFDKQIINNNKRIKLLEEMAQELYKEHFCRRLNRKENEVLNLGSLIYKSRKKLDKWDNLKIIDLSNMPSFSSNIINYAKPEDFSTNIFSLEKYDLLFGSIRPYLGKRGFSPINGAIAGTVLSFKAKNKDYYSFVYCLITSIDFINYMSCIASGTKMPTIKFKDLEKYKVTNFDKDTAIVLNKIVKPMIMQMAELMELNLILKEQRDLLLPRLMSGKLEV